MPTAADRGVDLKAAGSRREHRHDLLHQHRQVLIPQNLRDHAGLEGEALVLGSRDHAEIWAPPRWAEYSRSLEDPDAFAQAIAGLGI